MWAHPNAASALLLIFVENAESKSKSTPLGCWVWMGPSSKVLDIVQTLFTDAECSSLFQHGAVLLQVSGNALTGKVEAEAGLDLVELGVWEAGADFPNDTVLTAEADVPETLVSDIPECTRSFRYPCSVGETPSVWRDLRWTRPASDIPLFVEIKRVAEVAARIVRPWDLHPYRGVPPMVSLHDISDVLAKDLHIPSEVRKAAAFLDLFARGDNGRALSVQFLNLDERVRVALVFLYGVSSESLGRRCTLREVVVSTSRDQVAAKEDKATSREAECLIREPRA